MPTFHHVELDAQTGRHRLAVINQQMDYLGLIRWDGAEYIYEAGFEPACSPAMMETARKALPERDREILERERTLPQDFPLSWQGLTSNERSARVGRILREQPSRAYELLVSAWRVEGHQRVIETTLALLCRDDGLSGEASEVDPRWKALAVKLTKAVRLENAAAAAAHELAHRDDLLARAAAHLRTPGGVASYARLQSGMAPPEAIASGHAWRDVLRAPASAADALARLIETQPEPLEPRPRILGEDLITALGKHRHEPAMPLLSSLWESGQRELRIRAGHALLAFGDERAYGVLTAALPDLPPPYLRTAVMAEFARDPTSACDRLSPHIEARGEGFLLAVVDVLHRDHRGVLLGGTSHRWFHADQRWHDLLAPLAAANPKSNTSDPPGLQIAALAHELVRLDTG